MSVQTWDRLLNRDKSLMKILKSTGPRVAL